MEFISHFELIAGILAMPWGRLAYEVHGYPQLHQQTLFAARIPLLLLQVH